METFSKLVTCSPTLLNRSGDHKLTFLGWLQVIMVNSSYAKCFDTEDHSAFGTFAEWVVISATALKFAFLKEFLTSACFSFRKVQCVFPLLHKGETEH